MELRGKIIQILPEQSGVAKSGNPWRVQPYVLETLDQYPRKVYFEVFGDERIKNINVKTGDEVVVSFDIESREFNGRWYTVVRAWRVVSADLADKAPSGDANMPAGEADAVPADTTFDNSGDGGLPF